MSARLFALTCFLQALILLPALADEVVGPQDLALTFTSPFDGSEQPYRLYLPSAYDGKKALPLFVALHGTGGDQNKYFDHETYHHGIYKIEAEKRGLAVLCPLGTDPNGLPTEWRGEAELNVLAALEDVQRRFRIDPERLICSGQSMGGTGTSYLCSRYPDLFAAGVPLASTYSHVSLITNLRDVPMLYVQGGKDWPIYAATGPIPIVEEMKRLGYQGELWMIPESEHNTMGVSTPRVLDWALQQKRVAHPRHLTHRAYFPAHGRAWWVEIQQIDKPGWFAEVDAQVEGKNRLVVASKNTSQLILRPDPALLALDQAISLTLNGEEVFRGLCSGGEQLFLKRRENSWKVTVQPRQIKSRTAWRDDVLGTVDEPPTWDGSAETTLGNWLTDAMREISGADIAICTKGHHLIGEKGRGAAIEAGQELHLTELINWLRPSESALATFTLTGAALRQIIEANLLDTAVKDRFLVQVSGCRYRFDRRLPAGQRIVETDLDPERRYTIVCNSAAITRTDTLHLGDLFGKLNEEVLEPNLLSTAWRSLVLNHGRLSASLENRIVEIK